MTPSRGKAWFRRRVSALGDALAALPPSRRALALAKLDLGLADHAVERTMPAYLNDDELFFLRERCKRLEEMALRLATVERPTGADVRELQECAASVRLLVERAEARGNVH